MPAKSNVWEWTWIQLPDRGLATYSTEEGTASDDECRTRGDLISRTKCSSGHHCFCRLDQCAETICPQPQRRVSSSSIRNPSVSAASIVCRLCVSNCCLHTTFLPMFEDDRAKGAREWREFLGFAAGRSKEMGVKKPMDMLGAPRTGSAEKCFRFSSLFHFAAWFAKCRIAGFC